MIIQSYLFWSSLSIFYALVQFTLLFHFHQFLSLLALMSLFIHLSPIYHTCYFSSTLIFFLIPFHFHSFLSSSLILVHFIIHPCTISSFFSIFTCSGPFWDWCHVLFTQSYLLYFFISIHPYLLMSFFSISIRSLCSFIIPGHFRPQL